MKTEHSGQPTRRLFFRSVAAAGAALAAGRASASNDRLDALLDEVERRATRYFDEHSDPATGLVRDRARIDGPESRHISSIAATGFGLSVLAVAESRGYLPRREVETRVERTLEFLARLPGHRNGFFPHFLDMRTGERAWSSEYSSVDTAWLLCGVLHCSAHFAGNPFIRGAADHLLGRVKWKWMLDGRDTLCHGWTPERGFLPYRWDSYSELLAMYLLAIGSGDERIPAACWDAWKRPVRKYAELSFIDSATPLFTHQYSHAWFDFRGRRDRYADYFENSCRATSAHRLMCLDLAHRYPWYGPDMWGVTAADSMRGYLATPPDGMLVPCAAGGSVAFLRRDCGMVLEAMIGQYGDKVWCKYGFVDSFQPGDKWYSQDVIGIDLGIMALMSENARTESVWQTFMAAKEAVRAVQAVGLERV